MDKNKLLNNFYKSNYHHIIKEEPGIYLFYREENGFKFAYVGQSNNCLRRIQEHLMGYTQHIDLSLRTHGLFDSENNPTGYKIKILEYCDLESLNKLEMKYCLEYSNKGYQLRNSTGGSQSTGKFSLTDNNYKNRKGYREGIEKGYTKCLQELNTLLKYFTLDYKDKNKNVSRANKAYKKLSQKLCIELKVQ